MNDDTQKMSEEDTLRVEILDELADVNHVPKKVTAIEIRDSEGNSVLTVHIDAEVEYGDGVDPTEASKAFWKGFYTWCPFPKLVKVCSEISFRGPDLAAGLNLKDHQEWINTIGALVDEIQAVMPKKEG